MWVKRTWWWWGHYPATLVEDGGRGSQVERLGGKVGQRGPPGKSGVGVGRRLWTATPDQRRQVLYGLGPQKREQVVWWGLRRVLVDWNVYGFIVV